MSKKCSLAVIEKTNYTFSSWRQQQPSINSAIRYTETEKIKRGKTYVIMESSNPLCIYFILLIHFSYRVQTKTINEKATDAPFAQVTAPQEANFPCQA